MKVAMKIKESFIVSIQMDTTCRIDNTLSDEHPFTNQSKSLTTGRIYVIQMSLTVSLNSNVKPKLIG